MPDGGDLISLGFDIQSGPMNVASEAMDKMAASAARIEAATNKLTAATAAFTNTLSSANAATDKADAARASSTRVMDVQDAAYRRAMQGLSALANSQTESIRNTDLQSTATKNQTTVLGDLASSYTKTAAAIDVASISVRNIGQYDQEAAAAFRHATSEMNAASASRSTAANSAATASQTAAKEVASNYNMMGIAAKNYAADVEKTVTRLKVAEAYNTSLRPQPNISPSLSPTPGIPPVNVPVRPVMSARDKLMLSYQLNDIFTTVVGGMNPMMIAAQQGPQITQIFGGLRNTIAAIPKPLLIGGGGILAGLGIAAAIKSLKDLSDAQDDQKRRLSSMLGNQTSAANAYALITKEAIKTGQTIDDVSVSFTRFADATKDLGATVPQMMQLSTVANQLGRIGGLTPDETTAGADAISKTLKTSRVDADALQSIFDKMPTAGKAIADSLGISTTQLKLMAIQGDLTNKQVFSGLLTQTKNVQEEFDKLPVTVGSFFTSMTVKAEDLAVALYKSVINLQLITDRTKELEVGQNKGGKPYVDIRPNINYGTPVYPKAPERVNGEAIETDVGKGQMASIDIGRAVEASANAAVLAAQKLTDATDPSIKELKSLNDQIETTQNALNALRSNFAQIDSSVATEQIKKLTDQLQLLQEKADATGSAYKKAQDAIALRQVQDVSGVTPGQRAYDTKVTDTAASLKITREQAVPIVDAQQLSMINDMIEKEKLAVIQQTAITQAMRGGKAAADDMTVAMRILGISIDQLGNLSPDTQKALEDLGRLMREAATQARMQTSIDASKLLIAQLDGIAAAFNKAAEGAYAMNKAREEAVAAHNETGTGGLQLQVFEANQLLTDQQTVISLQLQTHLNNQLATAVGDVTKQKRIQLEYDIEMAKRAASPASRPTIEAEMRNKDASEQNLAYSNLIGQSKEYVKQQEMEQDAAFMTAEGAAKLRFEYQLLNQAKQLGIEFTPDRVQGFKDEAAAMAAAQAKAQRYNEIVNLGKSTVTGFITDMRTDLAKGVNIWDALGNAGLNALTKITDKLTEMAVNDVFDMAFGGGKSSTGGGGLLGMLGGLVGGLFGGGGGVTSTAIGGADGFAGLAGALPALFAKGGAFTSKGYEDMAFAQGTQLNAGNLALGGDIVSQPTNFNMADGRRGLMGEGSNPEAIMPLHRGADGGLGVRVSDLGQNESRSSQGNNSPINVSPVIRLEVTGDTGVMRVIARDEAGNVVAEVGPQIESNAVTKSTKVAPTAVKQDQQMRSPDWRMIND